MYQFFSKLGHKKRQCEWFPILIVRICLGMFFIFSGFFKIFSSKEHGILLKIFQEAHMPHPGFNAYLIPIIELIGGLFILIGFLTTLSAFILFILTIFALIIDQISKIAEYEGLMSLENFLYLPEMLYALLFLWLFFSGPGKISFDFHYGKKKRPSSY